jgi:hypothetical protein
VRRALALGFNLVVACAACVSVAAGAGPERLEDCPWRWKASFTPASDPATVALHYKLMESSIVGEASGVPVANLTFNAPSFQVRFVEGTIWPEKPVDGYAAGAWFQGRALVEFDPAQPKARADLTNLFGTDKLHEIPVAWVYFFTLRDGEPLTKQIGSTAVPSVGPPPPNGAYAIAKATMRQAGTEVLADFINRDGISKGAVLALFAPDSIRNDGEGSAALLYSYNPSADRPVQLAVFGHRGAFIDPQAKRYFGWHPEYKYTFFPVAWTRHEGHDRWIPSVDAEKYSISMRFSRDLTETRQEAVVTFTPVSTVAALPVALTSRLAVEWVEGPDKQHYPFVQWGFLKDGANFDQTLLIRPPAPLERGKPTSIKVISKGDLFDPSSFAFMNALVEEDTWYPRLADGDGAKFETTGTTPKRMRFVAAGRQISDNVIDDKRTVRFATSRPAFGSSFYVGAYDVQELKTDVGTQVQMFVERNTGQSDGSTSTRTGYGTQELLNAIATFNRILDAPLELETLRAVTTPTGHGRGFEGLLLLAADGALGSDSSSDLFRAHEVAHQWWGNMIQPDSWPEDRWLAESTADYLAMEFYRLRFKSPDKTQDQMKDRWVEPLRKATEEKLTTLEGQPRRVDGSEIYSLIDGAQNVYTKGPLVLHHLRYIFRVFKQNDEGFWLLLQDFLAKYKYKRASTADFIAMAEEKIGGKIGWFWDQWVYGTKIPRVSWSHEVIEDKSTGEFMIKVRGTQADTAYQLAIPVFITLKGGRTVSVPLLFMGKDGKAEMRSKVKPTKFSLNDSYEALVWVTN